jgi:predicted dinucleotide-binding enzyme
VQRGRLRQPGFPAITVPTITLEGDANGAPHPDASAYAQGNVSRLLPEGKSSGEVVAGWLPAGARLAMAFGTLPADLLESASNRSPEPAVLFYVTDAA